MNKNDAIVKEDEFFKKDLSNSLKIFVDLNEAIKSNNMQSIWRLSKIITRRQIADEILF